MKLEWQREGVVRITAKVEEIAALVAGARLALGALQGAPTEQVAALNRVLSAFDRAAKGLATPVHPTG